ncbi:curli-like amyloid fiber formation chaperone CsgH [Thioclava sp.]|uniref:curli-like amyloid fiber formation chaperone CsgH n=1 Tax=Thioclava sp. TaxID=1933450 RepID=UPI00324248A8
MPRNLQMLDYLRRGGLLVLIGGMPFGMALAMSAQSSQGAAPLSCEIVERPAAPHLELTARVQSARAMRGRYSFTVISSGAGGTSSTTQGGAFATRADEAQTLSKVYVSAGPHAVVSARLDVEGEGGVTCSAKK